MFDCLAGKLTNLSLTLLGTADAPGVAKATPSGGYAVVNGTSGQVVTSSASCPVLGAFQTQRPLTTDFTPLYIFIVLLLVVLGGVAAVMVYRRYFKDKVTCRGCGPAFKQVPQTA